MVLSKTYRNALKIIELVPPASRYHALNYLTEIINSQALANDRIINTISSWIAQNAADRQQIDINEDINDIMDVVGAVLMVRPADIRRVSRKRQLVLARQYCVYLIFALHPSVTYSMVGRLFNRDHATIIHSKRAFYDQVETSEEYYRTLQLMVNALKARGVDLTVAFVTLSNQRQKKLDERKKKLETARGQL